MAIDFIIGAPIISLITKLYKLGGDHNNMNTDKLTMEKTTLTVVHLAMRHKYMVPYHVWQELGKDTNLGRRKYDVLNVLKAINLVQRRGSLLYFDPLISDLVYPQQHMLFDLPEGDSETESVTEPFELPLSHDFSTDQMMTTEMLNSMTHYQGNPTLADYVFN